MKHLNHTTSNFPETPRFREANPPRVSNFSKSWKLSSAYILLLILFLVACQREPDAPPTVTPGPTATHTLTPVPTVPTNTPIPPSPTIPPTPTNTPTPEPTMTFTPAPLTLSITEPTGEPTLPVSTTLTIAGNVSVPSPQPLIITLSSSGLTLAETTLTIGPEETTWQALLDIPDNVTGPAVLHAQLVEDVIAVERIVLTRVAPLGVRHIVVTRPDANTPLVSGQGLYFHGQVQQPINNTVNIAVLYNDCQTIAAHQSFNVGEGGYWFGFIIIPDTVSGPACTVAYHGDFTPGTFSEGSWQADSLETNILPIDVLDARGVHIATSPFLTAALSETVSIFGTAYNAPGNLVQVQIEVAGRVVAEGMATTDTFGLWQIELAIPDDTPLGSGRFFATVTYPSGPLTSESPVTIIAAP